jgi:hypothetical protein
MLRWTKPLSTLLKSQLSVGVWNMISNLHRFSPQVVLTSLQALLTILGCLREYDSSLLGWTDSLPVNQCVSGHPLVDSSKDLFTLPSSQTQIEWN